MEVSPLEKGVNGLTEVVPYYLYCILRNSFVQQKSINQLK